MFNFENLYDDVNIIVLNVISSCVSEIVFFFLVIT